MQNKKQYGKLEMAIRRIGIGVAFILGVIVTAKLAAAGIHWLSGLRYRLGVGRFYARFHNKAANAPIYQFTCR